MKIIIHGTVGGYKVLYPSKGFSPIGDVRFNTIDERPVGQQAYSISFTQEGCVFSKYTIVRDVNRNMSLGNIAFSVIVPNNKKLLGKDATSLLDELSDHYCRTYAPKGNLENISDDWTFLDKVTNTFTVYDIDAENAENKQGSLDAAFIYYTDDKELQKYFDLPYQEEYNSYKQVFFINKTVEDKPENPINVLRHTPAANLTGKIDFEYYILSEFGNTKQGASIKIHANDTLCRIKDKIFKKDTIRVSYSINKYYKNICKEGRLADIAEYFTIDENNRKISVRQDVELESESKSITFKVIDQNRKSIDNAEIQINTDTIQGGPTTTSVFWAISWQKLDGSSYKHTFNGEELKDIWTISGRKDDYWGKEKFTPENSKATIELTLIEQKKNESKTENVMSGNNSTINGTDVNPWWYRNMRLLVGSGIACSILIAVFCLIICGGNDKNDVATYFPKESIILYVKGDSLLGNQLHELDDDWEKQKPDTIKNDSWLSFLGIGSKDTRDSTDYKLWKTTKDAIDSAITKRKYIDSWNFDSLKSENVHYSSKQKDFKSAIDSIDTSQYKTVKEKLGDVSKLTLRQIANSINKFSENKKHEEAGVSESPSSGSSGDNKSTPTDDEKIIIEYIKGGELNKDALNEYLTNIKKNLSLTESVKLCLELYQLNGKEDSSYYSLKEKIKKDKYLKDDTELYKFLDSMCRIPKGNIHYLEGTDKDKSKTLSQIKTKLKSKGTK